MDEGFKRLTIVDLLEQKEDLEIEHAIFDDHEHRIAELGVRLHQLSLQDEYANEDLTAPPMSSEAVWKQLQNPSGFYGGG